MCGCTVWAAPTCRPAATSPSPATPNSTRATSTRRCWRAGSTTSAIVWWIVDYNRQSLDCVVPDRLFGRIEGLFRDMGWNCVTIKYGRKLEAAFAREGGEALRALDRRLPELAVFRADLPGRRGVAAGAAGRSRPLARRARIIDPLSDDELGALMTNLGGHDIETVIDTLRAAEADGDQPTCFIAYTIKGMGLPFAGHKDNHAGLMTKEQMEVFRAADGHPPGPRVGSVRGPGRARGRTAGLPRRVPVRARR